MVMVLVNLSASNEVIGKASYRRQLVASQSGRCIAGYVYACNGVGESTTDVVFVGMIQRMLGPSSPKVEYLSRAAMYGALVEPKK